MELLIKTDLAVVGLLALALLSIFNISAEPAACDALYKVGRYLAQQLAKGEVTPEKWVQLAVPMNEQLQLAGCIINDNSVGLNWFAAAERTGEDEVVPAGDTPANQAELCRVLQGLQGYYEDLHFGLRTVGPAYYNRIRIAVRDLNSLNECPELPQRQVAPVPGQNLVPAAGAAPMPGAEGAAPPRNPLWGRPHRQHRGRRPVAAQAESRPWYQPDWETLKTGAKYAATAAATAAAMALYQYYSAQAATDTTA